MALQGELTWKGLTISNAYVMPHLMNYQEDNEPTHTVVAETLNEDGSVNVAEHSTVSWGKRISVNYEVKVYKDKANRDANPNKFLYTKTGTFTPVVTNSAKNFIIQLYAKLKASGSEFSNMADI